MALPWGLDDAADSSGRYERPKLEGQAQPPALVLTEAGEVLIRRGQAAISCVVALVIAHNSGALSRPQTERMQRAWDIALAVANGNSEAVHLQPMPHHWRFARVDYQTWDEWMAGQNPHERAQAVGLRATNSRDDTGARR